MKIFVIRQSLSALIVKERTSDVFGCDQIEIRVLKGTQKFTLSLYRCRGREFALKSIDFLGTHLNKIDLPGRAAGGTPKINLSEVP